MDRGRFLPDFSRGGGSAPPLEREPESVLKDVVEEKVSAETARLKYGVVIDPRSMAIDIDATAKLRGELAGRGPSAGH